MADTDRCSKREVVTRTRRVSRRGVSLVSMGEPVIIGPVAGSPHLRTIVWLPCFMRCAKELVHARLPRLRNSLPTNTLDGTRIVILCPPIRPVSCYGGLLCHAWHDYLTDHGGDTEGEPNTEERIDLVQLKWARNQVRVHVCPVE